MKVRKKISLLLLSYIMLFANCACHADPSFEPLADPNQSQSNSEQNQDNTVVGMHLFTYHTQKVYDAYSDSNKDVQISDFYPLVLTEEEHNLVYSAQVKEQYFDDFHSRMTFFCLENGQLCNLAYGEKTEIALSSDYRIGEEISFDYTLELQSGVAPIVNITACTDQNLPQTEEAWTEWSQKCSYIHAEILPSTDNAEKTAALQRSNSEMNQLDVQTYPTEENYNSAILKLSDTCTNALDFSETWNIPVLTDSVLYLYCLTPFDDCSLFLLIDDIPSAVFHGAYGADIEKGSPSQLNRIAVSIPELSAGVHYAYPLLLDRSTAQVYKGTPILLTAGEAT